LYYTRNEALAFEDRGNDIQLFQTVGWSIALENAQEVLKRYAKLITKSNLDDGVTK